MTTILLQNMENEIGIWALTKLPAGSYRYRWLQTIMEVEVDAVISRLHELVRAIEIGQFGRLNQAHIPTWSKNKLGWNTMKDKNRHNMATGFEDFPPLQNQTPVDQRTLAIVCTPNSRAGTGARQLRTRVRRRPSSSHLNSPHSIHRGYLHLSLFLSLHYSLAFQQNKRKRR